MLRYVKAAELNELSEGRGKRVVIEGTELALFRIQNQIYAVQNLCPHQQYSALHQGVVNGVELTCPMHGWVFDISTGQAKVGGGRLKRYSVKVNGNDVLLEVPDSEPDWAKK
jgi:3-phenylpropionate/trans-cinnamate dioxygenase ferredoxin subunit